MQARIQGAILGVQGEGALMGGGREGEFCCPPPSATADPGGNMAVWLAAVGVLSAATNLGGILLLELAVEVNRPLSSPHH